MDKIAVVILNYNTWKDSIQEADMLHNLCDVDYRNIIIVDNASLNESAEQLENNSSRGYVFIRSLENKGYAAGNNIGLKYAYEHGFHYAWILNNDIIIQDKDIISKLINVFYRDNSVAVVSPDIYSPDGHLFNRDAKRPNMYDYTLGIIRYRKKGRKVDDLGGFAYVYRPQGCCMMVDLHKMYEVDYLDENTFLYVEEPILAERLMKKKYRCACCLTARIIHNHSTTVRTTFAKKHIIQLQNKSFKYYLKQYRKYSEASVKILILFNTIKLWLLDK